MRKFGFGKKEKSSSSANPAQAKSGAYSKDSSSVSEKGDYEADSKSSGLNGGGARYGAAAGGYSGGGYGEDRYGNTTGAPPSQTSTSRYGAGGYGGLGGAAYEERENDIDEQRNALFGDRKPLKPQQPQKPQQPSYGQPPPYEDGSQSGVAGGSDTSQGYGGTYEPRELTAEEEEEEDVSATKQEIKFMKQSDVSSTRNALRVANQAIDTGTDTLARLGAQGEHIHNTEKNLDLAHNQNRLAEDKAREIKTLNRSMFAVHVGNPFSAGSRREARDQAVIDRHLSERDQREATRRAEFQSSQRMQQTFKELKPNDLTSGKPRGKNLAERAKYQFEANSDDEQMEDEIENNIDALGRATSRLHGLALATGREVDEQNNRLQILSEKGDRVDIGIASNRARLDRIQRRG
ncbi:Protein transport protein S9 plasma membrane t-SNARE [Varicellaria rhodocarpa]|nr:Protein transport protein S9 plasma membrane t-SNARE [Varicellaria rhodocarpa]